MPRIDSETFYNSAIKKHGYTPEGVCWLSAAHQQVRFETIAQLLPKKLNSYTLIDAGCGFGDFYTYLQNNAKLPQQYIGIDALQTMCNAAKQRTQQKIIQLDLTKQTPPLSDFIICSGAMNVLTPFETMQFIQNCYKASRKGFIFNILYGEDSSQTYNYLTKQRLVSIAKELYVSEVRFEEDYLQSDITVGFYK